jgi:DNA-binding NarL/FixJ family response regulator
MRAIVADDHPLYREAVRLRLERLLVSTEIVEASNLEELLAHTTSPGGVAIILLDMRMPGVTGVEAITRVVEAFPGAAVVLMSGLATASEVAEAVRMTGARGFLPKTMASDHFAAALKLILDGGSFVPADILHAPVEGPVATPAHSALQALTPREQQVLVRLATGSPNKEIGRDLGLAEVTVKLHVRQILKKIGARNRSEAASIATRAGII